MKVLFAVNNDKISEAVIKKYPKEYKELLSYKNVYYFNAILKEIQNDKSYDRIVISEDLEPFVNTNHDSIDNFIFNHLDKISDEAQGNDGREMSIILICSERRTFGSNILNKLFSIGIYNALIGNDRSMDNLCKLINRPRNKKEAKIYYKIDQATYESAVDNGEVSETEIQNILNHFKKLGKSTDRYTDSFNNIAAQYTDDQLKLIINVLPIKVKAVLEAESDKYQSLMGNDGENRVRNNTPVEPGISVNTIGRARENNVNGPIVIPSGVKKFTGGARPIIPNNMATRQQTSQVVQAQPVRQQTSQVVQAQPVKQQNPLVAKNQPVNQQQNQPVRPQPVQPVQEQPKSNIAQEPVNTIQKNNHISAVEEEHKSNGQRYTGTIAQVKRTLIARRKPSSIAPVTSNISVEQPIATSSSDFEEIGSEEQKRGRGRPRKAVIEQEVKPKGKRGRPRKNPQEDNNLEDLLGEIGTSSEDDDIMMPGLDDSLNDNGVLPGLDDSLNDNGVLPGLDDSSEDDGMLPGLDDSLEDDGMLPGLDDSSEDDGMLPGLDDNSEDDGMLPGLNDSSEDDGVLPGLDDSSEDDGLLPGLDDDSDEGEEVDVNSLLAGLDDDSDSSSTLPGLDDNSEDDGMLPGLDDSSEDDGLLPGLDDSSEDDGLLPGLDDNSEDDGLLPGLDDDLNQEETMLPGMGFEDEEDPFSTNSGSKADNNAIESIKPQINYSTSNLNSLLSKDKKIVAFLGATKNGTSFLINNLALMFSMMGINTAILDMTQNKNSYYLFTDSREELRKIAYTSLSKLENGYADGIKFNKNLTIYTALPSDGTVFENAEPILSTLVQNHSLVLIDTDFTTPPAYFASSQEIYLVQSMDILTIQPLTAFLRELKFKGAWEPEKARVVINKEVPIRILSKKTIVGGMSRYNGPDMSVMTDLFNKDMVNVCSIPFDEKVYAKYLETLATCKLSISSLPKQFRSKLELLANMVYPRLSSKTSYSPSPDNMGGMAYNTQGNEFSKDTNNILNKMKKKF